jgi:hypothetical protein
LVTAQITSVKLSDAIDLLRDDLVEAIEAAKRDHAAKGANPLTFEVTSTEVELSVALTKEGTAGAKTDLERHSSHPFRRGLGAGEARA